MTSIDPELVARWQRYFDLCHAIQTGVGYDLEADPKAGTPKHLRVGIDTAKVEHGALVALLIEKGLFTEREYVDKLIVLAENEVREYEERIAARHGGKTKITLR